MLMADFMYGVEDDDLGDEVENEPESGDVATFTQAGTSPLTFVISFKHEPGDRILSHPLSLDISPVVRNTSSSHLFITSKFSNTLLPLLAWERTRKHRQRQYC